MQKTNQNYKKSDIQLSKLLSYILRHGATKVGIVIDPSGYIAIEVLLSHPQFKGYNLNDIYRVVETNNKQRFTLTTDNGVEKIRANQGHSLVEVNELELYEFKSPEEISCCVHGTYDKAWELIKNEGLKCMSRQHIHFSATDVINFHDRNQKISGFRENCNLLIYIDVRKAMKDGIKFYRSENNVILSPGGSNGVLTVDYFLKVLDRKTKLSIQQLDKKVMEKNIVDKLKNSRVSTPSTSTTSSSSISSKTSTATMKSVDQKEIKIKNIQRQLLSAIERNRGNNINKNKSQIIIPRKKSKKDKKLQINQAKHEAIMLLLKLFTDCPEGKELEVLINYVQPNPYELQGIMSAVMYDLNHTLSNIFKVFEIYPFGSSINGLAFKESDFDFYIHIPECSTETINEILNLVYKAMRKDYRYGRLIKIENAKVPIIKFVHYKTNIECDINFTNCLGVYNSKFICHLLNFDYRIHSLMIVLKYWAKCHNLSGTGYISNYCLIIMVIFYLQTLDQPIIPAIVKFQENVDPIICYGWNMAYNENLINTTKNIFCISELVQRFFEFYDKFDYNTDIICPLYGRAYKKKQFETEAPLEFPRYNEYLSTNADYPLNIRTPLCVQDPFDLHANAASSVSHLLLQKFKLEVHHATEITKECLEAEAKSTILLERLFTEFAPISKPQTVPKIINEGISSITSSSGKKFIGTITLRPSEFQVSVLKAKALKEKNSLTNQQEINKLWMENATKFITDIFSKIYMLKLENLKKPFDDAKSQLDKQNNKQIILKIFKCSTNNDIWSRRRKCQRNLPNFLALEMEYSKKLLQLPLETPKYMEGYIDIRTTPEYDQLELIFCDLENKKKGGMKGLHVCFLQNVKFYLKGFFELLLHDK